MIGSNTAVLNAVIDARSSVGGHIIKSCKQAVNVLKRSGNQNRAIHCVDNSSVVWIAR